MDHSTFSFGMSVSLFCALLFSSFFSNSLLSVNDFINDNLKLGKKKIVVVHGIGEGILKEELRLLFKKDKRVKTMYTPASNIGCTIIELF